MFKALEMPKAEIDQMRNLEPRSRKLEQALKSARVKKPSHVYQILSHAPADEMVYLLGNSARESCRNAFAITCKSTFPR